MQFVDDICTNFVTDVKNRCNFINFTLFSIPTVFVSKEIIQRGDRDKYPVDVIEAHLIQALSSPTGTVRDHNKYG